MAVARDYKFMCSDPGQEMIENDIRTHGLNRVVVASCSPRLHEKTFRAACRRAGVNPYLFQMVIGAGAGVLGDRGRGRRHAQGQDPGAAAIQRVARHDALETPRR